MPVPVSDQSSEKCSFNAEEYAGDAASSDEDERARQRGDVLASKSTLHTHQLISPLTMPGDYVIYLFFLGFSCSNGP
jgi:hypothetical protein